MMIQFDLNLILVPLALLFTIVWAYDWFFAKKYTHLPQMEREYKRAKKRLPKQERALKNALRTHNLTLSDSELSAKFAEHSLPADVAQAYQDCNQTRAVMAQEADAPLLVHYSYGIWWILVLFVMGRSWLAEPYLIPSSSMVPTLHTGDFILVNKFAYGLRFPITQKEFLPIGRPKNGDVVTFRYPNNPKLTYVKRVIGVEGDTVAMRQGQLYVNDKRLDTGEASYSMPKNLLKGLYPAQVSGRTLSKDERLQLSTMEENATHYHNETLHTHHYQVRSLGMDISQYAPFLQATSPDVITSAGRDWQVVVPKDKFFMMGDNRDRSEDSRFWGFVDAQQLSGRVELVLAHKNPGLSLPNIFAARRVD